MQYTKQTISIIQSYCAQKPGAYEARPFGPTTICYKVMGKIFAQLNSEERFFRMTLKCDPDQAYFYRSIYPGVVVRGYHCPPVQQPYWNTIDLDAFEDMQILFQMMDEAYEAVVRKLKKKEQVQFLALTQFEYRDTDGADSDFVLLCERVDSIHDAIVVYKDNEPVACGAFQLYDEERAEIKHIYVSPSLGGIGLEEEIIRRLEAKAKMKGFRRCIIETEAPLETVCKRYN